MSGCRLCTVLVFMLYVSASRNGSLSGQTSCSRRWRRSYMSMAPAQIETAQCQRMRLLGRAADAVKRSSLFARALVCWRTS